MEEQNNVVNTSTTEKEGSKFGWGVLGFFIPLVGLILFLVWMKDKKKASKAAGIGALIGVLTGPIVFFICSAFFLDIFKTTFGPITVPEVPTNETTPVEEKCDNLDECYPDFSNMTSTDAKDYLNNKKTIKTKSDNNVYLRLYTSDCGNKEVGSVASLVRRTGTKYTKADGTKKLSSDDSSNMYFAICSDFSSGKSYDVSKMKVLDNLQKLEINPTKLEPITSNTDLLYKDYGLSIVLNGENVDVIFKPGDSLGTGKVVPSTNSFTSIKAVYGYVKYSRTAVYLVTNDNKIYAYNIYWSADIAGNMGIKAKEYQFDEEIDSLYYFERSKEEAEDYEILIHTANNNFYNFDKKKFDTDKSYANFIDNDAYLLTNGEFSVGKINGKAKAFFTDQNDNGNMISFIDEHNNYYSIQPCIECFLSNFTGEVEKIGTISSIIELDTTNNNSYSKKDYYLQIDGTDYYKIVSYSYLHKGVKNGQ